MHYFFIFLTGIIGFASCRHINVYEKQVTLPGYEWRKNQNAVIRFDITDSTHHQLYFVVRHNQRFGFNKLLVKLLIQDTTKKTLTSMNITAPLTNAAGEWAGTAMGDVYYQRVKINPPIFFKPGSYRFVLQLAMKEPAVADILNVGIALDQ